MKREIIFRGKCIETGEWVSGFYGEKINVNTGDNDSFIITPTLNFNPTQSYFTDIQVIPDTVGQFTGLFDKNGKKIFEGDILENKINKYYKGRVVVIYSSRKARFEVNKSIAYSHKDLAHMLYLNFEVIGNIHNNTELLEETK